MILLIHWLVFECSVLSQDCIFQWNLVVCKVSLYLWAFHCSIIMPRYLSGREFCHTPSPNCSEPSSVEWVMSGFALLRGISKTPKFRGSDSRSWWEFRQSGSSNRNRPPPILLPPIFLDFWTTKKNFFGKKKFFCPKSGFNAFWGKKKIFEKKICKIFFEVVQKSKIIGGGYPKK